MSLSTGGDTFWKLFQQSGAKVVLSPRHLFNDIAMVWANVKVDAVPKSTWNVVRGAYYAA